MRERTWFSDFQLWSRCTTLGLLLLASICVVPVSSGDGSIDGRIGESYGSTRAIDSGNDVTGDGECPGSAGRGNMMDFFAMSIPGGSGTNDPWYFSWTVDSSHPLIDTTGNFFGDPATNRVNYLIGIEVNCDGAPRLEMWQDGQPWEREFAWNVDYFIAMFATGTNTMEAQLWRNDGGNNRSLIAGGITVTSQVAGFRRRIEFALPTIPAVPLELRNNSTLCLYLISVRDIEGSGTVLDGIGLMNHNVNCPGTAFDLSSLGSVFVNTAASCKTGGRPTDPGTNTRQCLSNPDRSSTTTLNGQSCSGPFGIAIDGQIDSKYVLLTESAFAAPYAGGAANGSDFVGESSARTYTYITGVSTSTVTLPGGQHGDIANIHAYGDTNYLYLIVTGPTALGWELEPDLFNLYIAIDMPGRNSGNDTGAANDLAPGAATAPASRLVNFKGWDPDYVVELVWRGLTPGSDTPGNLYESSGSGTWFNAGTFLYQNVANTSTGAVALYYSRTFPQYEFAIPWNKLGRVSPPNTASVVRIGAYTTADENMAGANHSRWDIADQAPGIGQGCGGEGCHERVGDDALDDDALISTGAGDRTPYVGRSFGLPSFPPATDNSTNDVDTIEEYFSMAFNVSLCNPVIDIKKYVNNQDADLAPGPLLSIGSTVTWSYVVSNPGNIALTNVAIIDDRIGSITNHVSGDANNNKQLDPGESWTYTAFGIVAAGAYVNTGTVHAVDLLGRGVSDTDPAHHFGASPGIHIEKWINGQDADTAPGAALAAGSSAVWTYILTNTGNISLSNVVVNDDKLGVITNFISGDLNSNSLLDIGEVWIFSATGTVVAGAYVNTGLVQAVSLIGQAVTATDPAHHFGGTSGIDIEKTTNGQDADFPTGPYVPVGSPVTWSYIIRNNGNTVITNVTVYDNDLGVITNLVSGDVNNDRALGTNEVWTYSITGTAQAGQYANVGSVTGTVSGVGSMVSDIDPSHYFGTTAGYTLQKTRLSPTNRPALIGESVMFSINVANTGNVALTTVLVEDAYELSYLAFVGAVPSAVDSVNDGLITWTNIGPLNPGASTSIVVHFTAVQDSSGTRTNRAIAAPVTPPGHPVLPPQTSSAPYQAIAPASVGDLVWHDLNGNGIQDGGEPGLSNVVVTLYDQSSNVVLSTITAGDGTYAFTNLFPGSYFVGFSPPAGFHFTPADQGGNDQADSDAHPDNGFTPPFVLSSGEQDSSWDAGMFEPASIGDFIWFDQNSNGIQDPLEAGYPDVKVMLYGTNMTLLASTTSAVNGAYAFTNLPPGSYLVRVNVPLAHSLSPPGLGTDGALDSDFSPLTAFSPVITLLSGQHNPDIDGGLFDTLVYASIEGVTGDLDSGTPVLGWRTSTEHGTAGWYVEREVSEGVYERVSEYLPAVGSTLEGARYGWPDAGASAGGSYRYRIVEVEARGGLRVSDPYEVTYPESKVGRRALAGATQYSAEVIPYEPVVAPLSREKLVVGSGSAVEAVKVYVKVTGLQRVTAAQIASVLGVSEATVASGPVRVEHLGQAVPVLRAGGDVVFHGEAYQSMYTDQNVYRIVLGAGRGVPTESTTAGSGPATTFMETLPLERQLVLYSDIFEDAGDDIWLWYRIISGLTQPFTTSVTLPGLVSGTGGELKVRVKGGSQTSGNGMHGYRVELNGTVLGRAVFFGLEAHEMTLPVPGGAWTTGANQLRVVSEPPAGVTYDHIYVDRFEARYVRSLTASTNRLVFTASAGPVKVSGFSNASIEVWDITDSRNPVRLTGADVASEGGGWSVNFTAPRSGRYTATASNVVPVVAAWYANDLKDNTQRVDYLVIHGAGLSAGAEALAADRASKGLRTKVVSVESVFDAFNHGIRDGRSIKAFLGYAYRQWETGPRYVVLAGDGSLDYLNRTGAGDSLVPTAPEGSPNGVYGSDHGLGDINGDGYLEMAVGRIPVTSAAQLSDYVSKLQNFEQGGSWRDQVVVSTDNSDQGGDYLGNGNELSARITSKVVSRADITTLGATGASTMLKDGLGSGSELTVYIGHGDLLKFAHEGIFLTNDVPSLLNSSHPGVVMALGCLMGTHSQPGTVTIGEKLVVSTSGASAMIGCSTLVNNNDGNVLGALLVDELYTDGTDRLGDALVNAKNSQVGVLTHRGMKSYQLLGDPTLAVGDVYAPRGGPSVTASRPGYDEWLTWAFPPVWQEQGLSTAPGADADGDGLTNWEEYLAGTDPLDALSDLVVVTVKPMADGTVQLSWPSVPGRTYRIERASVPFGSYTTIANDLPASAPVNSWVDGSPLSTTAFYRVYVK